MAAIKETTVPVESVEKCIVCQGQYKIWLQTKNRKNINKAINLHKEKVHGIPFPQQQQQQQQQQQAKKQRVERGHGGPPSSDDESDGLIDGFAF